MTEVNDQKRRHENTKRKERKPEPPLRVTIGDMLKSKGVSDEIFANTVGANVAGGDVPKTK